MGDMQTRQSEHFWITLCKTAISLSMIYSPLFFFIALNITWTILHIYLFLYCLCLLTEHKLHEDKNVILFICVPNSSSILGTNRHLNIYQIYIFSRNPLFSSLSTITSQTTVYHGMDSGLGQSPITKPEEATFR